MVDSILLPHLILYWYSLKHCSLLIVYGLCAIGSTWSDFCLPMGFHDNMVVQYFFFVPHFRFDARAEKWFWKILFTIILNFLILHCICVRYSIKISTDILVLGHKSWEAVKFLQGILLDSWPIPYDKHKDLPSLDKRANFLFENLLGLAMTSFRMISLLLGFVKSLFALMKNANASERARTFILLFGTS